MTTSQADPHAAAVLHLSNADPRMAALIGRAGPCRLAVGGSALAATTPSYKEDHFSGLVDAIVSQQLSGKAAATIFRRVLALGSSDEGRLLPEKLLALPEAKLREAGLSGSKAAFVRDLATRVSRGTLMLDALDTQADDEVIAELCQVKGIGRWTAEMFLMFRLGRQDVLPVGDLGVQKGFVKLFGLRKIPAPERMEKLAKPFRPYRSVACWYLWRLNEEKPGAGER